jgi:hypothetical protein
VVLFALLATAIAGVAVVAAIPGMQPSPPDSGRAEGFVRPFDYQVPAGSGIRVYAKSDHLNVLSEPPADVWGISIWAVGHVLKDPCDWQEDSTLVPREPGVEGLLSYIRSVDRLHVEDVGPVVIDSRPAFRVDLSVAGGKTGCEDPLSSIYLWRDERGTVIQVPQQGHVPLTILDVDGETIAIEIWAGGHMEGWLPTAEKIVDSIRFLYRPPAEASPATPTRSP